MITTPSTTTKNITKSRVEADMGYVQLLFVHLDADRHHLRFANDEKGPMLETKAKWRKPWVKKQLGTGDRQYFAVLTSYRPAPGSATGATYDILGVLAKFDTHQEMKEANHMYWRHLQTGTTGFEKLERTFEVAHSLKKWLDGNDCSADYNLQTHELLEMCVEGRLKEVKRIVKDLV